MFARIVSPRKRGPSSGLILKRVGMGPCGGGAALTLLRRAVEILKLPCGQAAVLAGAVWRQAVAPGGPGPITTLARMPTDGCIRPHHSQHGMREYRRIEGIAAKYMTIMRLI